MVLTDCHCRCCCCEVRFVDETVLVRRFYEGGGGGVGDGEGFERVKWTGDVDGGLEQFTSPLTEEGLEETPPIPRLCDDGLSRELEIFQHAPEVSRGGLRQDQRLSLNGREATLMRNYVENMALWVSRLVILLLWL